MKPVPSTALAAPPVKPRATSVPYSRKLYAARELCLAPKTVVPEPENPPRTLVSTGTSRRSVAPETFAPKYVKKCPNSAWQNVLPYHLLLWPLGEPQNAQLVTAQCRSWRCEGECRRHNGKVTWARIVEALEPQPEEHVLFAVLTIDQKGRYSQRKWPDSTTAYRELSAMTSRFLKRINRMFEDQPGQGVESRWVAVVEQHRSGWPHVNLVLVCPGLSKLVREQQAELDRHTGEYTPRERIMLRGEALRHAQEAGWGRLSSLEAARSRGAIAGYLVKLCGLHDEPGTTASRAGKLTGEIAKLSQIPMAAPKGFRRLRSGVRFLPPRHRSAYTGALVDKGTPVGATAGKLYLRARRLARQLDTLERLPELPPPMMAQQLELLLEHGKVRVRIRELAIALASDDKTLVSARSYAAADRRLKMLDRHELAGPRGSPRVEPVGLSREALADAADVARLRARALDLGLV